MVTGIRKRGDSYVFRHIAGQARISDGWRG
jgi:hypothetical protein